MNATILRADARNLPLPDASVDLVVTSPPYYALRSYTDGGEHYDGQLGSEATPAEYVANLLDCTREWVRVLKPSGSIWVNLGDKYSATSTPGPQSERSKLEGGRHKGVDDVLPRRIVPGVRPKSLIGLPWRYALGCIDQLGLILRAEVIWSKPNGLPESVTDRVRRSHEQWFHFTTQPRYFSAVDEIREPQTGPVFKGRAGINAEDWTPDTQAWRSGGKGIEMRHRDYNPLGKLPGSVWEIATQPLTVPKELGVDHFAAFPMEWPRRIILGWSPAGICTACGEGRRPISETESVPSRRPSISAKINHARNDGNQITGRPSTFAAIVGYVCACPEPTAETRPAVVLDPFGGTGTTALVASALGRHGISVDRSADYCRLAAWRVNDPGQRAKAMRVDKPEPIHPDQLALELEGLAS